MSSADVTGMPRQRALAALPHDVDAQAAPADRDLDGLGGAALQEAIERRATDHTVELRVGHRLCGQRRIALPRSDRDRSSDTDDHLGHLGSVEVAEQLLESGVHGG